MVDNISIAKRSKTMAAVKSKETSLEVNFRKKLWSHNIRYRKNASAYFGKPDILIKKYKLVIFIDSCFWHGCIQHVRFPSGNNLYWKSKIKKNVKRDKEVSIFYMNKGWKIIRVWEHELKDNGDKALYRIKSFLK